MMNICIGPQIYIICNCSFREDFSSFNQSEWIIANGSHVDWQIKMQWCKNVDDHTNIITTKFMFGPNWPNSFRDEILNINDNRHSDREIDGNSSPLAQMS